MPQTNNYVQKYVTPGGPLTDSLIYDDGTHVGIGATSLSDLLTLDGGGLTLKSGNVLRMWRSDNGASGTLSFNSSNQFAFSADITMGTNKLLNVAELQGNGPNLKSLTGGSVRLSNYPDNGAGTTAVVVDTDSSATTTRLFAIRNNGAEKFTVDSSGNVGIGITSPIFVLHVQAGTSNVGGSRILLCLDDISPYSDQGGGGLAFRGKYNNAGSYTYFGGIDGVKSNATDGDLKGELRFQTPDTYGNPHTKVIINSSGNLAIFPVGVTPTPSFGGGEGVIYVSNAATTPSSNPSGGGILYVDSGALKYRGSSGTVTTIAPA